MIDVADETSVSFASLAEVAKLVRDRVVSPVELMELLLRRIERHHEELNCFITVTAKQALVQARAAEKEIAAGRFHGPLHGIPISLKDNIATAGIRTTAGSRILADWIPSEDATAWRRLKEAGAILVAKANCSEFAYGAPHPDHGLPRNPWDFSRNPGGSSSGSASALAAGLCFGSLGTDTGGSIRIPSALCGVVGLKPTFGLVSRRGVVPISYNLDHVGPMTRTVTDAALMLEVLAESRNGASRSYTEKLEAGVDGLRIGITPPDDMANLDPEVRNGLLRTYVALRTEGAELIDVRLPDPDDTRVAMWTIAGAEAADYHRRDLRTRPEDFGPEVRAALQRSEYIPATAYVRAQRVRQWVIDTMRSIFDGVDALVVPAIPFAAHPLEQRSELRNERQRFTTVSNLTGQPALVLPIGLNSEGLPIAVQVIAPAFEDVLALRVGRSCERAAGGPVRERPVLA